MHTFPSSTLYPAEPQVLFCQPYGQILYYPAYKVLYTEIIGTFTHQEYRRLYTFLLGVLKTYPVRGCIASQAKSNGSSIQDRAWLVTSWFSQLKNIVGNDFILIGLREAHDTNAFKRWIADYLEKTLSSMAAFTVRSMPDFDSAVTYILERSTLKQVDQPNEGNNKRSREQ
ncbi:MAG: hypothetical protein RMJ87_03770 [Cytophagales bacterium]|nr:hypothetical protein [Bernardetiaceae bacterium]MDW8204125.1 hypothetical protein [Cytophagales bacterium]